MEVCNKREINNSLRKHMQKATVTERERERENLRAIKSKSYLKKRD